MPICLVCVPGLICVMTSPMSLITGSQSSVGGFCPDERVSMLKKFMEVSSEREKNLMEERVLVSEPRVLVLLFLVPLVELVVFDEVCIFLKKNT